MASVTEVESPDDENRQPVCIGTFAVFQCCSFAKCAFIDQCYLCKTQTVNDGICVHLSSCLAALLHMTSCCRQRRCDCCLSFTPALMNWRFGPKCQGTSLASLPSTMVRGEVGHPWGGGDS